MPRDNPIYNKKSLNLQLHYIGIPILLHAIIYFNLYYIIQPL